MSYGHREGCECVHCGYVTLNYLYQKAKSDLHELEIKLAAEQAAHEETLAMWRDLDVLAQRIYDRLGLDGGDQDSILPAIDDLLANR